ncbi:hypothetical protein ACLB1O_22650 [Escherichia coli]
MPDAARGPYPAYSWASFEDTVGRIRCASIASDIIAALEFGNSAGCGASALSGLRLGIV